MHCLNCYCPRAGGLLYTRTKKRELHFMTDSKNICVLAPNRIVICSSKRNFWMSKNIYIIVIFNHSILIESMINFTSGNFFIPCFVWFIESTQYTTNCPHACLLPTMHKRAGMMWERYKPVRLMAHTVYLQRPVIGEKQFSYDGICNFLVFRPRKPLHV